MISGWLGCRGLFLRQLELCSSSQERRESLSWQSLWSPLQSASVPHLPTVASGWGGSSWQVSRSLFCISSVVMAPEWSLLHWTLHLHYKIRFIEQNLSPLQVDQQKAVSSFCIHIAGSLSGGLSSLPGLLQLWWGPCPLSVLYLHTAVSLHLRTSALTWHCDAVLLKPPALVSNVSVPPGL